MTLYRIRELFSVCKVLNYTKVDPEAEYIFAGKTPYENSLVCPTKAVPDNTTDRNDGWRAFRIDGTLDFSLIGIIANISKLLAENNIGIFVVSTYDTDYILTKEADFERAAEILSNHNYTVL